MEDVLNHPSVVRVQSELRKNGISSTIVVLQESARSAVEAATALGIELGQVASSIIFKLPTGAPLLVITSGRHRVNTELVAHFMGVTQLHRADAEYVKAISGFAIGGVSPLGWLSPTTILIDEALNDYEVIWAAAGHPHAVFQTSYLEMISLTKASPVTFGD
jgi:prolyl-tRNA editing enzyme YbaK/EbsC (Cys-tRNA(Pro) deacylase)